MNGDHHGKEKRMIKRIDDFIERYYWPGIALTVCYFGCQVLR